MSKIQSIEKLARQIKDHEGLRLKPYRCTAGKLSIGYGRNLEDRGLTDSEASYLLQNDINAALNQCMVHIPYWELISEERKCVLINMCFNLGLNGLLKFRRMHHALAHKNYKQAAVEMLDSRWAGQVGQRAEELAEQMRSGKWGD